MAEPIIVQALYNFKGTNNDELWFKKGDKITVTQKEEGGWWEGTLGEKTGWFPANFVKEIKDSVVSLSPSFLSQQKQNRIVVLKDIVDSEKAHVAEMKHLVENFLKPMENAKILTCEDYALLTSNITDVLTFHSVLLEQLQDLETQEEQRLGKIFLSLAPKMQQVHEKYCQQHPRAVCVLDANRDDLSNYMQSLGAASPGILVLSTALSKPFRRLEKYSGMLQEWGRHVEINHSDKGDALRAKEVMEELANKCSLIRRQKELELQILTGPIRGWEGQRPLSSFGEILKIGSVRSKEKDRMFVLFKEMLVVLSVSQRMSAFVYEGKLPLSGITANRLDDDQNIKNAFEISGPMIEKIIAVCQTKDEADKWVSLLSQKQNNAGSPTQKTPLIPSPTPNWSPVSLRPSPLIRFPSHCPRKPHHHQEDAQVLKVIESYCQGRVNSKGVINNDLPKDKMSVIQEEVQNLQQSVSLLLVQITEEKVARIQLQKMLGKHFRQCLKE